MVIDGSGFYEMFNWYSLKKELEEFQKMLEELELPSRNKHFE